MQLSDSVTSIGEDAFYRCTSLTDVYYGGSEDEWNEIGIEDGNDPLLNATIHFAGKVISLGDVNNDDAVDASDLTALARHVAKIQLLDAEYLEAADVNKDGNVDATDLTMLARYVAKIITSLD